MGNYEMLKGTLIFKQQEVLKQDKIFSETELAGRKSDFLKYNELKKAFKNLNVSLSTFDINIPSNSHFILNIDFVNFQFPKEGIYPLEYLILTEIPSCNQESWMIQNHLRFKRVFTYNKEIADGNKYIYIPYSVNILKPNDYNLTHLFERKQLVMIANPANHSGLNLLYNYRIKIVNWYQKNCNKKIDVFGNRWFDYYKEKISSQSIFRLFPKKSVLLALIANNYIKYFKSVVKGAIPAGDKSKILKEYKFSICFENEEGPTGNITEKIFDCFESLIVPIYLGPKNITEFIPASCFIDFRRFNEISELNSFISEMTIEEYEEYIKAIIKFIHSEDFKKFETDFFVKTISDIIITDQNFQL